MLQDVYKRQVVQRGDTLYGISKKFGTTMQKVLQENGLSRPEELKIGREITVSCPGEGFVVYSLKSTDTLEDVALKDVYKRQGEFVVYPLPREWRRLEGRREKAFCFGWKNMKHCA